MLSRRVVTGIVSTGILGIACIPVFGKPAGLLAPADPSRNGSELDRLVPMIDPVLHMKNSNTEEVFSGRYFYSTGYDVEAVRKINWFMRDWREKETVWMDVRLFWALSAIRQAAMLSGHNGIIRFNSGYRTRRTNNKLEGAVRNSMHLRGQASDFALPGIPPVEVYRYARFLGVGGVGSYPSFTHIDTGAERHWGKA